MVDNNAEPVAPVLPTEATPYPSAFAPSTPDNAVGIDGPNGPGAGADDARPRGDGYARNERGERRLRDPYGRDRRARGDRPERARNASDADARPTERDIEPVAPVAAAVVITAAAPVAPQPSAKAMPRVRPYVLSVDDMGQVASSAGLQWVQSDHQKVAVAQDKIAQELAAAPARIPRERPAPVVLDTQPLVLVETRKDLAVLTTQLFASDEASAPDASHA